MPASNLPAPRNSPYWVGVVQGAQGGIDGLHWQVQIRAPGIKPRAFGTSPNNPTTSEMYEEDPYPIANGLENGKVVRDINVMYGARLTAEQYERAMQVIEAKYTNDISFGMWSPAWNSCRMSAVKAYSDIIDSVGAWSPEATTIRHDWMDRAKRTMNYQIDAGEFWWGVAAAVIAIGGWTTPGSGGTPHRSGD